MFHTIQCDFSVDRSSVRECGKQTKRPFRRSYGRFSGWICLKVSWDVDSSIVIQNYVLRSCLKIFTMFLHVTPHSEGMDRAGSTKGWMGPLSSTKSQ